MQTRKAAHRFASGLRCGTLRQQQSALFQKGNTLMLPNTIQLESLTSSIRNVINKRELEPQEQHLLYRVATETFNHVSQEPNARKFDRQEFLDACGIKAEWSKAEAAA